MISKPASEAGFDKKGTFIALCEEIQCYTEVDTYGDKEPLPNLTFCLNLGDVNETGEDVIFYQGFVTIYLDADGYPKMGGKNSRYYKLVSALFGEQFDPKDPGIQIDIGFPKEYNSVEGIVSMPSFKDYAKDEPRLRLEYYKVNGVDIIGKECQVVLDYPENPSSGAPGKRIAVVQATPLAKAPVRRNVSRERPAGAPS